METVFIRIWFALLFIPLIFAGPVGTAIAQSTLNSQQKIQVVNIAANAAAQQVKEKKDFPLARLLLLSAIEPAFRILPSAASNPKASQAINSIAAASAMAWPNAPKQPDAEAMTAFLQSMSKNTEVAKLAIDFDIFNVPSGKAAYRRMVSDIKVRGDEISKYMSELVKDAPPAAHFLMSPGHLQIGMYTFNQLFKIVFSQVFVGEHVKKIVPQLIAEANVSIAAAKGSEKVTLIKLKVAEAMDSVSLLKNMDAKNVGIKSIEGSIKTAYEHLNKVYAAQVAKNRVPGDSWKGSEVNRKAIQEAVGTQYAKQLPDDEIIKSHITSEAFSEVWEAWWDRNDVLRVAYAGYVHVATVMKHKSGSYRVIGSSFRRTLSGDKWLAPKKWKPLYNFEILKENI